MLNIYSLVALTSEKCTEIKETYLGIASKMKWLKKR